MEQNYKSLEERGKSNHEKGTFKTRRGGKRSYIVSSGDDWFSIADTIYGDQRMAGALIKANAGIFKLYQGQVLQLPAVPEEGLGEAVFLAQSANDQETEKMAEEQDADRKNALAEVLDAIVGTVN